MNVWTFISYLFLSFLLIFFIIFQIRNVYRDIKEEKKR